LQLARPEADGSRTRLRRTPIDIRFKPHAFDGWSERHWTAAFRGERFSLVWFSPNEEAEVEATSRYV
jgi:hypothetical protein